MVKIAVVGGNEFIVGFQLAGIKDVFEVTGSYFNELKNLKNRKDIGIILAFPATISTAMVSPIALPSPSITAAIIPDKAAGIKILLTVFTAVNYIFGTLIIPLPHYLSQMSSEFFSVYIKF